MLSRLTDFDRTFGVLDELRRQMDRAWDDFDGGVRTPAQAYYANGSWPRFDVEDTGANLVVSAELPGMTEKDLDVALEGGVLSVRGERKADAREGYTLLRRERPALRFARSVVLPVKVDAERTSATVKDGVLTITIAKAREAQPRKIAVRATEEK
jgi:HSP20 family protein